METSLAFGAVGGRCPSDWCGLSLFCEVVLLPECRKTTGFGVRAQQQANDELEQNRLQEVSLGTESRDGVSSVGRQVTH